MRIICDILFDIIGKGDFMIDRGAEYDELLPVYQEVEQIAFELISNALIGSGIHIHQIAHRIKEKDSALEKLDRKSTKYKFLSEFTDMVGFRVICYFSEQVNAVAEILGKVLDVDYSRSIDKRAAIDPTRFGYISLHFICSLPKDKGYRDELSSVKFEIQMRSILQHAWAEIEHDLGYKTEFAIPTKMRREFSRVAGLLEIADECFDNIRKYVSEYEEKAHNDILNGTADDMTIDLVTLKAVISYGKRMSAFVERIAGISGAKIVNASPESYVVMLTKLGITKIGDLYEIMDKFEDKAFMLAEGTLKYSEIDTLVSTVGLYYLCRATLVFGAYSETEIFDYFVAGGCDNKRALDNTKRILTLRNKYCGAKL